MTTEITQTAQLVINWLKDPLTKGYIDFLKFKQDFYTKRAANIVESAIVAGNIERIKEEISIFNLLRSTRELLEDLLPCFNIAYQEKELTKEDVEKLQDLFETLTQNAI